MDPYLFKRLWRRPWLSLCSLILAGLLCFLLTLLSGYRQDQEVRLQEVKDNFEISCVVTNLSGSNSTNLKIEPKVIDFVCDRENGLGSHIREVRMTKRFEYTAPTVTFEYFAGDMDVTGVTGPQCVRELDPGQGGFVTWLEEGFYESSENICVVSQMTYDTLGGSVLPVNLTDPVSWKRWRDPQSGSATLELRIVGYYTGGGADVYIPFGTAQRLSEEICGTGGCDAIAFLAADNEGLDELREAASGVFYSVNLAAGNTAASTLALNIYDEQYRATVAALEQNIRRTALLLPLILLVSLGVGFLVSILATRSERRTYALMRTLGMTRGRLFGSILREQLLLPFLAAALTALAMQKPTPALVYLIFHTIGCCIAVIRSVRVPPTAILREQE